MLLWSNSTVVLAIGIACESVNVVPEEEFVLIALIAAVNVSELEQASNLCPSGESFPVMENTKGLLTNEQMYLKNS